MNINGKKVVLKHCATHDYIGFNKCPFCAKEKLDSKSAPAGGEG